MSLQPVNLNHLLDSIPQKKEDIINDLKEFYAGDLTKDQQLTLNTLIDWIVEFKYIPAQKPSKNISEKPLDEQVLPLLKKWLSNYINSLKNPLANRKAKPLSEKDIVKDPALGYMLSLYYEIVSGRPVEGEDIEQALQAHQILMAIEYVQGNFLEGYIASVICKDPYNFIWCDGQTLKAADFCKRIVGEGGQPELKLIQVKNKHNTENSSSKTVRNNTTIEYWFRLGKRTGKNKNNIPVYKWDKLSKMVEDITGHNPKLNEEDYIGFLKDIISKNPYVLYNQKGKGRFINKNLGSFE
ncbi:SinI family restriction endonuclease [Domibacillus sp. PGB-M46]|uniref:SinI family restriction endonuclease n=1 Tax=Domibacillus sp. PGB-M46 TaxID=2910255 RepID=UPI001F57794C|nr:SinI family restriction endonuclease [Domibacillus sp. PGB-M46]MCI2255776.1 SinI family restriction endonuclease [Domibacillus sp. PGB-M46]